MLTSAVANRKGKNKKNWSDWNEGAAEDDDDPDSKAPIKLSKQYSPIARATMDCLDQRVIPYDLIIRRSSSIVNMSCSPLTFSEGLLERICFEDPDRVAYSAAVLVFLPGMAEIRRLHDTLSDHPSFGSDAFNIYPLHSTISSENQSAAFDIPPPGVRKIVICRSFP